MLKSINQDARKSVDSFNKWGLISIWPAAFLFLIWLFVSVPYLDHDKPSLWIKLTWGCLLVLWVGGVAFTITCFIWKEAIEGRPKKAAKDLKAKFKSFTSNGSAVSQRYFRNLVYKVLNKWAKEGYDIQHKHLKEEFSNLLLGLALFNAFQEGRGDLNEHYMPTGGFSIEDINGQGPAELKWTLGRECTFHLELFHHTPEGDKTDQIDIVW